MFEWHLIISKSFHSFIEFSTKLCMTSSFYYLSLIKKKFCNLQITNVAAVAVGFELIPSDSKTMFFPKLLFSPIKTSLSIYLPPHFPSYLLPDSPSKDWVCEDSFPALTSSMMRQEPWKLILEIWMENNLVPEQLKGNVGRDPGVS